ncbi:hypothetical protein [Maridesulfovibrio ferrireducens]|uniref:hypothetical protein n=1 Tax=Maridesulfovibrio ferrireducens TaxID=246191 RepID=UPI001A2AE923|nr:hypothetical protein [Maridesulfovibrio ferrireducens]MBI9110259.1 hypothetical protein [Maridesulfovibrio ferrireducens]
MTAAEPAVDNIIDDLRVRCSEGALSEFEIAMYNKRAQNLLNSMPIIAYCALGILGFIEKNETKMRKNHLESIRLATETRRLPGLFMFNFGCSLCGMGYAEEGADYLFKAYEHDKTNLRHLNSAIIGAYQADDQRLDYLLEQWAKLNEGEPHPIVEEIEDAEEALEALKSIETEGTVSWKQVKAECKLQ